MAKKKTEFDVIVAGAGPAGATVAAILAKEGCSVALLDRETFPRPKSCAGWVNPRTEDLLKGLGVATKKLLARPIGDVIFHNANLSQYSVPKMTACPGYFVDRGAFDEQLVRAAKKAGAHLLEEHDVSDLNPLESGVEVVTSNGERLTCKLLVLAVGATTKLRARVGLKRSESRGVRWTAMVEQVIDTKPKGARPKGAAAISRMDIILGVTPENGLAVLARQPDRIALFVNSPGERNFIRDRLVELAAALRVREFLPEGFAVDPSSIVCAESCHDPALELDSHVGKNTLTIGDAGGFVAAVSQEGIYPSMWSAQIAADVIRDALAGDQSQDALMTFDTRWRLAMGDYLRPPNTDLQLLAPLIFSNQPMTDRMAKAFFFGENI